MTTRTKEKATTTMAMRTSLRNNRRTRLKNKNDGEEEKDNDTEKSLWTQTNKEQGYRARITMEKRKAVMTMKTNSTERKRLHKMNDAKDVAHDKAIRRSTATIQEHNY